MKYLSHIRTIFTLLLLALSVLLITFGVLHGELKFNILPKAISICLECIGIG